MRATNLKKMVWAKIKQVVGKDNLLPTSMKNVWIVQMICLPRKWFASDYTNETQFWLESSRAWNYGNDWLDSASEESVMNAIMNTRYS